MIMQHKSRIRQVLKCFSVCILFALPLFVSGQTATIKHKIAQGETLYGIARKYGTTTEEVVKVNPGINADNIQVGAVINIPAKVVATVPQPKKETTVAKPQMRKHTVVKGETIWSISQHYGITPEELVRANPELSDTEKKLKKGMEINIPVKAVSENSVHPAKSVTEQSVATPDVKSNNAKAQQDVSLAVVLPITTNKFEGERCLEFYRGFLMGLEEVKKDGHNVTVYTYDENENDPTLSTIFDDIRKHPVNAIIGPLYPEHFNDVAAFARQTNTKIIVPFSSKIDEVRYNPYVYVINTPDNTRNERVADLFVRQFKEERVIFLTSTSGKEQELVTTLRSVLTSKGRTYSSLPIPYTNEDFKALLNNSERFVLVPDNSNKETYAQVMKFLREFRQEYPGYQISLLGFPEWSPLIVENPSDAHFVDTYLLTTGAFYNPSDSKNKTFEVKFKANFHTELINTFPRMAPLGYDIAQTFVKVFAEYGNAYENQKVDANTLQSDFKFERLNRNGGYVNETLWFMHYKRNNTIDRIAVKN